MTDMLRVMTDGLEFLRPFAVTGNLHVIDVHYQVDIDPLQCFRSLNCSIG